MTKSTSSGTQNAVHNAASGAAAGSANPSQGSERFERFIALFADGETHKAAAKASGLTLREIAERREADETFEQQYKLARKTRLMALHDAVWSEAIGQTVTDPVNGTTRIVRNVRMLERLAVTERELEPEKPTVAIQNNVQAASDPKLVEAVKQNSERLRALLRGGKPAPRVIDVTPEPVAALPAPTDEDLL